MKNSIDDAVKYKLSSSYFANVTLHVFDMQITVKKRQEQRAKNIPSSDIMLFFFLLEYLSRRHFLCKLYKCCKSEM